ncbi:DUF3606 domain-containing protein [Xenophilus arseniciresistens]|uniref:DUF3606 domain-containing protein n=1 Tax=Xenophilus arseniciresistens TaxID=1283306 RepID=A0AAE3T2K7_9BURK|nr:DUF3606 domain-containing protein [Xenophilus arseniciresistens]MDA7419166.1 DUF3606 domain-containing protein [Xenophilus arseniciresistens]
MSRKTATDNPSIAPSGTDPDRIDLRSEAGLREWTRKLDVSEAQLQEAIDAVGDRATDVELHLKGSRSTTNQESVAQTPAGNG